MDRRLELLDKFAKNKELLELIDLIILDYHEEREKDYFKSGKYKEERDMLGKLKFELKVREAGTSTN